MEGDNGGGRGRGKGCQGACVKDTWSKPDWGRIKGGRWGWLGAGVGKMEATVLEQQ